MKIDQLFSNPTALIALLCIIGFVVAINLPLLFPLGLGKMFEREAKTWNKALRGGSDTAQRNDEQMDELHRRVEELKTPPEKTEKK